MRRWGYSAAALALLCSAPLAGQEAPKSLLPDVFGAAPAEPAPQPAKPAPAPPAEGETAATPDAVPAGQPAAAVVVPTAPDPFRPAPAGVRSLDVVGPLSARLGGYGVRAFAGSDGRFVTELINRIKPPLASRWGHIALRRALLSRVPTPAGVRPADWVAARALLLLKMGEVDGAKLLVDALPVERYTPRLYGVASQVHLAAADIPALCLLAPSAKGFSKSDFWELANAICAGFEGDDITAATKFDVLRSRRQVASVDLVLAERITSLASGEGRGANVDWSDVEQLNAYRFGLAVAAGIEIPERLTENPSATLAGWMLRAAGVDANQRSAAAPTAASYGIASAAELAAIAAGAAAAVEPGKTAESLTADLRTAFSGRTSEDRIDAMRRIWDGAGTPAERYGRLVQTAAAAARVPASATLSKDAADLVQSMLAGGYVSEALAWWPTLVKAPREDRLAAWPYLVLADVRGTIPGDASTARDWFRGLDDAEAKRKGAMLAAAMRGLGRRGGWDNLAGDLDVAKLDNSYTRRLGAAAAARRRGEVAILAGAGLQSNWSKVAPGQFEAVVAGLNTAGFRTEARMIAVEALTRN